MKKIIFGIIVCLIFSINSIVLAKDKPPTVEINPPRLVSAPNYNAIVEPKEIKYTNDYIEVDLKIPVITYNNKVTEKIMNDKIEKPIMDLKNSTEKEAKEFFNTKEKDQPFMKYNVTSDYEVTYNQGNVLSVVVTLYNYTGGAHGNTEKIAYNFDLNTGKTGYLKDFLYEEDNYRKVILDEVRNQISKEPEKYFKDTLNTLHGIPYDQNFYLTKDGIVVYYPLYDIAPYVAGIPEFKIPYSKFKHGLKKDVSIKSDNVSIEKEQSVKKGENYSEYLYYPQIKNLDNPIIEKQINTIITKDISNFTKDVKKKAELSKGKLNIYNRPVIWGASVYSDEYFVNPDLISIDITYSANDGSTINYILYDKGYNFNLITGENYKLSDVFKKGTDYVTLINTEINNQIENIIKSSEYKYDYNFKTIKAEQPYYIYRGNLVILFEAGEILSKDFGAPKFYIPLYKFDDKVNPQFIEH